VHALNRHIAIVGAASNIGIRPYDGEKEARHLDRAPAAWREAGIVHRLAAEDRGDITPAPYRDFTRPPGGVRNESEVEAYSRALADRVASCLTDGRFPLVLGGDCSIILGSLLGTARLTRRVGLAYIDAHADFGTPQESKSGSAASMCLALAVGRGDTPLARLGGSRPLVRGDDVVLLGRRDEGQANYGHGALGAFGVLDLPGSLVWARPTAATAATTLERVGGIELDGFWIHVDVDVLDSQVMPAVDSPAPGGPGIDQLAALVVELTSHPRALGMQITIYDPALDADRACASRLVSFVETVLAGVRETSHDRANVEGPGFRC
jgi:arginase